jgi:hypothetical protein
MSAPEIEAPLTDDVRPPQFTIRRLLIVVAVAAGLSWLFLTGPVSYSEYLSIDRGMTKDEVAAILGHPEWVEGREASDYAEKRERWCYSEHRIGFDYYVIVFDADGRVINTHLSTTLQF